MAVEMREVLLETLAGRYDKIVRIISDLFRLAPTEAAAKKEERELLSHEYVKSRANEIFRRLLNSIEASKEAIRAFLEQFGWSFAGV